MKLKKISVPKFIHVDDFGSFEFQAVEILFDPKIREISPEDFNQDKDEYFLSDETIKKMTHDAAARFYNSRLKEILLKKRPLTSEELKGIKVFLGVTGAQLGDLIGLDKSGISRALSEKQPIMYDKSMLLMERLKDEIQTPGHNKMLLESINGEYRSTDIENLNINIFSVAEYLIRYFEEKESCLTHLKLQKMVYYAQGIALGKFSLRLFKEPILAWGHGPVVKELYDVYKKNINQPIIKDSQNSIEDILNNEKVKKILDDTISIYGIYDAWYLANKTHNELPWMETKRGEEISIDKILSFFQNQVV